jgi:hypothetical protein
VITPSVGETKLLKLLNCLSRCMLASAAAMLALAWVLLLRFS